MKNPKKALWAACLFWSACNVGLDPSESAESQSPLYQGKGASLWPVVDGVYSVPVCHRACKNDGQTNEECETARDNVSAAIRDWSLFSRVAFPNGIGECPGGRGQNLGSVAVLAANPTKSEGGTTYWMQRDSSNQVVENRGAVGYPGPTWEVNVSTGTSNPGVIRHEFGHALSFLHEYARNDEPATQTCDDDRTNSAGVKLTSTYDVDSIMNYSYCNSAKELSPDDVRGLQSVYGKPYTRAIANVRYGSCLRRDTDKLGKCNGNDTWYYDSLQLVNRADKDRYLNEFTDLTTRASLGTKWNFEAMTIRNTFGQCLTAQTDGANNPIVGGAVTMEKCAARGPSFLRQLWRLTSTNTRSFKIQSDQNPALGLVVNGSSVSLGSDGTVLNLTSNGGKLVLPSDSQKCVTSVSTDLGSGPVNTAVIAGCAGDEARFFLQGLLKNASTGEYLVASIADLMLLGSWVNLGDPDVVTTTSCDHTRPECLWQYRP